MAHYHPSFNLKASFLKVIVSICWISIIISACTTQQGYPTATPIHESTASITQTATEQSSPTKTVTMTPQPTPTSTPTLTPTPLPPIVGEKDRLPGALLSLGNGHLIGGGFSSTGAYFIGLVNQYNSPKAALIYIMQPDTYQILRTISIKDEYVKGMQVSEDDAFLMVNTDTKVYQYQLETGFRTSIFSLPENSQSSENIETIKLSPDGKTLVIITSKGLLYFITLGESRKPIELDRYKNRIAFSINEMFAISKNGQIFAFTDQKSITLIDINTLEEIQSLPGANVLTFDPSGAYLLAGSESGVTVWETKTWTRVTSLPQASLNASSNSDLRRNFGFSNNGLLLGLGKDGAIHGWEMSTWKYQGKLGGAYLKSERYFFGFSVSPRDSLFYVGNNSIWSLENGEIAKRLEAFEFAYVQTLAVSPDGQTLALGGLYNIYLVNLNNYQVNAISVGEQGWTYHMVFSEDGKTLIYTIGTCSLNGTGSGVVEWRDMQSGEVIKQYQTNQCFSDMALSNDKKTLAIGLRSSVLLWDMQSGKQLSGLTAVPTITSLTFSPDDDYLVASTEQLTLNGSHITDWSSQWMLWDVKDGYKKVKIVDVDKPISGVQFLPDQPTLLTTSWMDNRVQKWNIETGDKQSSIRTELTGEMKISPDYKYLAIGNGAGYLMIWDIERHKAIYKDFLGNSITDVAFSPDGQYLYATLDRGEVGVWALPNSHLE